MTQTLREQLGLTREDLSFYLGVSTHMVKSLEMGRRHLPMDNMAAVATLFQVMADAQTQGPAGDPAPPTGLQIRRMKRLYRYCARRLENCTNKLKKTQESYASACARLAVYQLLAQSLTPARSTDNRARLKWTEWKIAETMQRVQDNNATAQEILAAEIAGLESMVHALERSNFFPFKDTK
jgi:ribosome-binding protein aMBF1 (putative translation factor)